MYGSIVKYIKENNNRIWTDKYEYYNTINIDYKNIEGLVKDDVHFVNGCYGNISRYIGDLTYLKKLGIADLDSIKGNYVFNITYSSIYYVITDAIRTINVKLNYAALQDKDTINNTIAINFSIMALPVLLEVLKKHSGVYKLTEAFSQREIDISVRYSNIEKIVVFKIDRIRLASINLIDLTDPVIFEIPVNEINDIFMKEENLFNFFYTHKEMNLLLGRGK